MARRLSRGRKLLFTAITLVAFLGLFEGGARVWEAMRPNPSMPEPVPQTCPEGEACFEGAARLPDRDPDPEGIQLVEQRRAGWGFVPGSQIAHGNVVVTINELGLRGPGVPRKKGSNEVRLLSLGDSSVYGYGVADGEIFLDLAAELLEEGRGGATVRAVNGALPGYSSHQALAVLRDVGPVVDPDWLVIACIWSDLFHTAEPLEPESGRSPLAAVRLMQHMLEPWLPARTIGWWDPEQGVGTPGEGRTPRVALTQYMDNLHALATEGDRLGARSAFLVLPAPVDLDPAGPPAYVQDYRAAMATVAKELDAPLIDAPRYFMRHDATGAMFFDQVHPSVEGHRLLGGALADDLGREIE